MWVEHWSTSFFYYLGIVTLVIIVCTTPLHHPPTFPFLFNRTTSVLSRLLFAPPNSPLQYPTQGFKVLPLTSTLIPGMLHSIYRSEHFYQFESVFHYTTVWHSSKLEEVIGHWKMHWKAMLYHTGNYHSKEIVLGFTETWQKKGCYWRAKSQRMNCRSW